MRDATESEQVRRYRAACWDECRLEEDMGFRGFVFRNAEGLMVAEAIARAGEVIQLVRPAAAVPVG